MAVARLTAPWILEILKGQFSAGVARRTLLDSFAALLVSPKSSPGAKGRLAKRLYARLNLLQRKGRVEVVDGVVRLLDASGKPAKAQAAPVMSVLLRRKQFSALMVEDRDPAAGGAKDLRVARHAFLAQAVEEGWTVAQAAEALGMNAKEAEKLMAVGGK